MIKKEIVNTSLKFCFLPDLLFFALAYISWSFNNLEEPLLYAPFKSVSYILLYILAILSFYVKLYHWRELNVSFKSYIMFLLTCIQFSFYIWSIFFIIFYMKNPIYLQNLSMFSQYRYLSFFILLNIAILFSIIIYLTGYKITHLVTVITFPYMKEEIRLILYTWNDSSFGPICNYLMEHLFAISNLRRIFYFSIHFIIFYLPRLLSMLFLLNFIYFGGDLRYILLFIPIFFISWLFSFFDYYFYVYFENTGSYIRALLEVSLIEKPVSVPFKGIVEASDENIMFSLTSFALSRGYTQIGLSSLKQTWYLCARLAAYFMLYNRILFYFTRVLLVMQFINCFGIVYFFFFKSHLDCYLVGMPSLFSRFSFRTGVRTVSSYDPWLGYNRRHFEAQFVDKRYRRDMEHLTDGIQVGGHPCITNVNQKNPDNAKEILYLGEATHGKGSPQNPSQPLHPTTDLQGNNQPQQFIPVKTTHYFPFYYFTGKIPGSEAYLSTEPVKSQLAKHVPQDENT